MDRLLNTPVPERELPQRVERLSEEHREAFVDICAYSGGAIRVNMQYVKKGITGAIPAAYVRETVAKKLLEAKKLLPPGYTFEILDAWRPYEVQLALFNEYRDRLAARHPEASLEALDRMACEFVSYPDKSKQVSFVHSSGGAVDLRILNTEGLPLDMGSDFDAFTEKSYTVWYEKEGSDPAIRDNRRLLYNVLTACGFTNYPAEWWHYDFGDVFWAYYTGRAVLYCSEYDRREVTKK